MVIGISFLVVVFSYRHSGRESHPTRSLTANFLACLQLPSQRPREIIIEDLSHLQGKARSKKISRLCSSWARNENQERITVHAYVGGSGIKTVNAAYSSQTCPDPGCGYVHRDNRHGDMFHCRNPYWECNWQGDVDHVAAMNIKSRIEDHQINRFTPFGEVKKILEERFLRANGKPSWNWEVGNHRLALVLSLRIGQNIRRRRESENKRGAYRCICILKRDVTALGGLLASPPVR